MKKILLANSAARRLGAYALVALAALAGAAFYLYNERTARAQYEETNATTSLIARAIAADDHVIGDRKAPLQLIVYSDFSCPFCNNFFSVTLPQLQAQYGSLIVIAYRHLPLTTIHPRAFREAQASECAAQIGGEKAFWGFERAIYAHPDFEQGLSDAQLTDLVRSLGVSAARFVKCLDDGSADVRIRADMTEAAVAGLNYTPTTILKSAHRAVVIKGAYHPRYVTAIDYILNVEHNISTR